MEDNKKTNYNNQILEFLDTKFGTENLPVIETYILPNGHFLDYDYLEDNSYCIDKFKNALKDASFLDKEIDCALDEQCCVIDPTIPSISCCSDITDEQQAAIKSFVSDPDALDYNYEYLNTLNNLTYDKKNINTYKFPILIKTNFDNFIFPLGYNNIDYFIEVLNKATKKVETKYIFNESIEKHEELNPVLFDSENKLKSEVKDKIIEIVDFFIKELKEDDVKIEVKDIIIIGSNASYNYTKDSDIDIHIVADTSKLNCSDNLYPTLYSAYRTIFKNKLNIEFYDIPVELYVETDDMSTVSNGIYSVMQDKWVKEPEQKDIPELDTAVFDEAFSKWKKDCDNLIDKIPDIEPKTAIELINKKIEEIYELRKKGLKTGTEYNIQNLIFKELRNVGILDGLKNLKDDCLAKSLSLFKDNNSAEDLAEALSSIYY